MVNAVICTLLGQEEKEDQENFFAVSLYIDVGHLLTYTISALRFQAWKRTEVNHVIHKDQSYKECHWVVCFGPRFLSSNFQVKSFFSS